MRSARTDYSFWERPGPDRTRAKCLLGLELGRQEVCALGGHGGTDYPHVCVARSLWVRGGEGGQELGLLLNISSSRRWEGGRQCCLPGPAQL